MSLAHTGAVLTLSTESRRSTLSLGKGDGRGRLIGEAGGASNVRLNIEEICLVIYFRSLYYIMI